MAKSVAKASKSRSRRGVPHTEVPPEVVHDIEQMLQRLQSVELIEEDGEPLESEWHVVQIHLLDELVRQHLGDTGDYFCGGNMFVYYSLEQAEAIASGRPAYKGPDFFVVRGVDGRKPRRYWVSWQEEGRYPDLVVELVSPRTAKKDKEENVRFYAEVLRVLEYFWYDQDSGELAGYHLVGGAYEPIEANEAGWLWSKVLGAYLGVWFGEYMGRRYRWLRLYGADGVLVPTVAERLEQERQRAERAEAELERLRALLRERGLEI